jgi:hypothetical protein
MLQTIQPYAKAIVAYGGAIVTTATILATAQHIDATQITQIVIVWLTALGVYQVPNAVKTL